MTRTPDFDELVGGTLESDERERLRRVHDLLVAAGPPPELSPELEAGPDLAVTYRRRFGSARRRRPALLAAAALALLGAFYGGYLAGNDSRPATQWSAGREVVLRPTAAAPGALAALRIGAREPGGNWPMRLVATGLPPLPKDGYYMMFLTRGGKVVGPCGSFVARGGRAVAYLNAPYRLRGAGWIVAAQRPGDRSLGRVVLRT